MQKKAWRSVCSVGVLAGKPTDDNSIVNHRIEIHIINQTIYVDKLVKTIDNIIKEYFNI